MFSVQADERSKNKTNMINVLRATRNILKSNVLRSRIIL